MEIHLKQLGDIFYDLGTITPKKQLKVYLFARGPSSVLQTLKPKPVTLILNPV